MFGLQEGIGMRMGLKPIIFGGFKKRLNLWVSFTLTKTKPINQTSVMEMKIILSFSNPQTKYVLVILLGLKMIYKHPSHLTFKVKEVINKSQSKAITRHVIDISSRFMQVFI